MFNVWPFLDLQNWQFFLVWTNKYKNDIVHTCAKKQWGPQYGPGLVQFYSRVCLTLPHNLFQIPSEYRYFILRFLFKSAVRLSSTLSTGHLKESGTQHGRPCASVAVLAVEWSSSGWRGSSCLWHCPVTALRAPQPLHSSLLLVKPKVRVSLFGESD